MAMTLKPKPNHPNRSVQKSQDRKKHVHFVQMLRFYSLISSIAMASMVYNEFLPQGHTVNKEYYLGVMRRLHDAIRQNCQY